MDDRGNYFWSTIHHIEALRNLDVSKLPSRMPPVERRDVKAKITPGKSIVEFVRSFLDRRVQLSPTLTDGDLWTLLKWRPTEDSLQFSGTPSRQWKSWAKRELTSAKESGSPLFLSRVLRVALDCYKYATHSYIEGYNDLYGLERNMFSTLYQECEYLCNVANERRMTSGYTPFNTACEEANGSLLVCTRDYNPGEMFCYKLTFIGEKECQRYGSIPPPFFQHEIKGEVESGQQYTLPPVAVTTTDANNNDAAADSNAQAAAKSGAIATGIGMGGTGGDGGNIESGAVNQNQNVTVNSDAAEVAKAVKDGMLEAWKLGRESTAGQTIPPPGDIPVDDDILPQLGSWVSRADLATKLGKTTDTLKNWENKGRGPGDVVWPKTEGTSNNAYYNFREVWRSFLSLLPDADRAQKASLIEGLSVIKRP